jgi:hypothetical protein
MAQWQSQSAASRRQAAECPLLCIGEKSNKRGSFDQRRPFYSGRREREREEVVLVLHVSNSQPTARQSGGDAACIRFPYLGSLIGGRQSGFQTWREPEPVWAALFISLAR